MTVDNSGFDVIDIADLNPNPFNTDDDPRPPTIKERDPEDRPMERAISHGCGVLSVSDLWALVLRTGQPGKPITELCREMMKSVGSLHTLQRRSRKQLMSFKGIGITKAIQIEAVMELVNRFMLETPDTLPIIKESKSIFEYMCPRIGNLPHEEIWVLYLNRRNQVTSKMMVTSGTATSSVFDLKKILKHALLEDAQGVVMCHNHPSGNLLTSPQDDSITRSLKRACDTMELRFLDHVVITASGFYSYRDNGKL